MGGEDVGWYLVVGVMPLAELMADSNRKRLGKIYACILNFIFLHFIFLHFSSIIGSAFKHVAKEANMELRQTLEPDGLFETAWISA